MQGDLAHETLSGRARIFCSSAIQKLGNEIRADDLEDSAVDVMCLFVKEIRSKLRRWLNGHLFLHELGRIPIQIFETY